MQVSETSPQPQVSCGPMPCEKMPILRRNDRQAIANGAVKTLQHRLKDYGFRLAVDGFFGAKTEAAVLEFQRRGNDHDFSVIVDGIVGPQTWSALRLCTLPAQN